jgi:hypothetical protein
MATRMVKIKECALVLPGYSLKGALHHEPDGTIQVISSKHLDKDEPYVYQEEHQLKTKNGPGMERCFLEPGNILFMSRGNHNYGVLLKEFPRPAITTLTFYVIKANEEIIKPCYLAWCLNQNPMKNKLNEIRTGAGMPMIPRAELGDLLIPLPSLDQQEKICFLADLQSKEKRLLKELLEETERLHRTRGKILFQQDQHFKKERKA